MFKILCWLLVFSAALILCSTKPSGVPTKRTASASRNSPAKKAKSDDTPLPTEAKDELPRKTNYEVLPFEIREQIINYHDSYSIWLSLFSYNQLLHKHIPLPHMDIQATQLGKEIPDDVKSVFANVEWESERKAIVKQLEQVLKSPKVEISRLHLENILPDKTLRRLIARHSLESFTYVYPSVYPKNSITDIAFLQNSADINYLRLDNLGSFLNIEFLFECMKEFRKNLVSLTLSSLVSLDLPNNAFEQMEKLEFLEVDTRSPTIPSLPTPKLTYLSFTGPPSRPLKIYSTTFKNCENLETLAIKASRVSIEPGSFQPLKKLEHLSIISSHSTEDGIPKIPNLLTELKPLGLTYDPSIKAFVKAQNNPLQPSTVESSE